MKQNVLKNQAVQEGIFFLLIGGALLTYGINSYQKGFNKDWAQSPYLFPVLVAVIIGILAVSLLYQGISKVRVDADAKQNENEKKNIVQVAIVLGLSLLYYIMLGVCKIPYITFGIMQFSLTISNFEILTVVFLMAMMLYLGVRKIYVLLPVSIGMSLFLSVAFRAMLHVLLP